MQLGLTTFSQSDYINCDIKNVRATKWLPARAISHGHENLEAALKHWCSTGEAVLIKLIGSIPPAVRCAGPLGFTHQGGNKALSTPNHAVDIALRIKRAAGKHMEAE